MRDNAIYGRRQLRKAGPKIRQPRREFDCTVVHERVVIGLRRSSSIGFEFGGAAAPGAVGGYYVTCSERECQYVDRNLPPCPLNPALFENSAA